MYQKTGKIPNIPMTAVSHAPCKNIQQLDKDGGGVTHERFPNP
jgi:hypothetical protein